MTETETAPIQASDRVSDVLARDEALVEVFVRQSPHFTKLRNRTLRRVMARLVTVEDAAKIAGIAPAGLVGELNAALGIVPAGGRANPAGAAGPTAVGAVSTQGGAGRPVGAPVIEVDVREDLRAGREPFSKIMAAVSALAQGEVLRLRATFEPAPLYAVLGKRGFVHETHNDGPEDWSVFFWRAEPGGASAAGSAAASPQAPVAVEAGLNTEPGTVHLDVRGLEPPEPMQRTLEALEALPAGQTLVQINVRVPQFLLPILAERGYEWEIDESAADRVLVRIRRRG
jgi:uncharacterized protein (DUF2249 family)